MIVRPRSFTVIFIIVIIQHAHHLQVIVIPRLERHGNPVVEHQQSAAAEGAELEQTDADLAHKHSVHARPAEDKGNKLHIADSPEAETLDLAQLAHGAVQHILPQHGDFVIRQIVLVEHQESVYQRCLLPAKLFLFHTLLIGFIRISRIEIV